MTLCQRIGKSRTGHRHLLTVVNNELDYDTVIVRMSGFAAHNWGNQVLTLATFLGGVHLDWLPCSTVVSLVSIKAMTASYLTLHVNISS